MNVIQYQTDDWIQKTIFRSSYSHVDTHSQRRKPATNIQPAASIGPIDLMDMHPRKFQAIKAVTQLLPVVQFSIRLPLASLPDNTPQLNCIDCCLATFCSIPTLLLSDCGGRLLAASALPASVMAGQPPGFGGSGGQVTWVSSPTGGVTWLRQPNSESIQQEQALMGTKVSPSGQMVSESAGGCLVWSAY